MGGLATALSGIGLRAHVPGRLYKLMQGRGEGRQLRSMASAGPRTRQHEAGEEVEGMKRVKGVMPGERGIGWG